MVTRTARAAKVEVPAVDPIEETPQTANMNSAEQTAADVSENDIIPAVDGEGDTEEKADETPEPAKSPFDLMDAAEEIPASFVRSSKAVDYEEVTHPRIKEDMKKSFDGYKPAKDSNGTILYGKPGTPLWMKRPCPTAQIAVDYVAAAKKYCAFREWTLRATYIGTDGKLSAQPTPIVRFNVKPKEVRVVSATDEAASKKSEEDAKAAAEATGQAEAEGKLPTE